MEKRFQERTNEQIMAAVEEFTGKKLNANLRKRAIEAAGEEELVNSGLEETMIGAYRDIRAVQHEFSVDLRTAAFISAIGKVATAYTERGIFP
jgi:glutamate dehydrogenase (NAD(P)+)